MTSPDRVMATRGPAGAGKTTMMQEAVAGSRRVGIKFSPSRPAPKPRAALFGKKGSITRKLWRIPKNESLHSQLRGQVLWVDEAGLLSARQMRGIFQLAEKQDCRVIFREIRGNTPRSSAEMRCGCSKNTRNSSQRT